MRNLSESVIHAAMFCCLEGYVSSVVDSVEFVFGRKLSSEEQQQVYQSVEKLITEATRRKMM